MPYAAQTARSSGHMSAHDSSLAPPGPCGCTRAPCATAAPARRGAAPPSRQRSAGARVAPSRPSPDPGGRS
eukprot:5782353-Prymnesium_polylepis.1